jgi:hypothetical protein
MYELAKKAPQYHDWIDEHNKIIMPQRRLSENSVYYDIKESPQDYLPLMIYMMKAVELSRNTISNVFPLRTELIPKHFRLDTTSLINILLTKFDHPSLQGKLSKLKQKGNLKKTKEKYGECYSRRT